MYTSFFPQNNANTLRNNVIFTFDDLIMVTSIATSKVIYYL